MVIKRLHNSRSMYPHTEATNQNALLATSPSFEGDQTRSASAEAAQGNESWSAAEISALLRGQAECGSHWSAIKCDERFGPALKRRSTVSLKSKWARLTGKVSHSRREVSKKRLSTLEGERSDTTTATLSALPHSEAGDSITNDGEATSCEGQIGESDERLRMEMCNDEDCRGEFATESNESCFDSVWSTSTVTLPSSWSAAEVSALKHGFKKHGNNWRAIISDESFNSILRHRSTHSVKSKWSRMVSGEKDSDAPGDSSSPILANASIRSQDRDFKRARTNKSNRREQTLTQSQYTCVIEGNPSFVLECCSAFKAAIKTSRFIDVLHLISKRLLTQDCVALRLLRAAASMIDGDTTFALNDLHIANRSVNSNASINASILKNHIMILRSVCHLLQGNGMSSRKDLNNLLRDCEYNEVIMIQHMVSGQPLSTLISLYTRSIETQCFNSVLKLIRGVVPRILLRECVALQQRHHAVDAMSFIDSSDNIDEYQFRTPLIDASYDLPINNFAITLQAKHRIQYVNPAVHARKHLLTDIWL